MTDPASPPDARDDSSDPASFSLVTGDPLYHAQRLAKLIPARGLGTGRRIVIAVGITWLPLALWALWNNLFLPSDGQESLLRHFGIHARLLVAVPLFFICESQVDRGLRRVLPQFITSGLVDAPLVPQFRNVLLAAARLRDSRLALAVILAIIVTVTASGWTQMDHNHELDWGVPIVGGDFAAMWFSCVSRPIFLLLVFVWLWRLIVVTRLFQQIASLDLRLAPTHPDRAAGLAFVEKLPAAFAPFFLGISVVIAARWAHDALYHGLQVDQLGVSAGLLVATSVLIGLAPLAVFAGKLIAFKRASLVAVNALLADYGRLFTRRWMKGETVSDDRSLLGAPEIGPVADTVALYEAVRGIRAIPVSRASLLPIALASALPIVPVFATQMPMKEAVLKLLGPLMGF